MSETERGMWNNGDGRKYLTFLRPRYVMLRFSYLSHVKFSYATLRPSIVGEPLTLPVHFPCYLTLDVNYKRSAE